MMPSNFLLFIFNLLSHSHSKITRTTFSVAIFSNLLTILISHHNHSTNPGKMSSEKGIASQEVEYSGCLKTELTLGLPGGGGGGAVPPKSGAKRCFSELKLGSNNEDDDVSVSTPPPSKDQVVGWPPVRSYRKKMMMKSCKYVKVAVDGAPYLRKLDLQIYNSYHQMLAAFEDMFTCLTICNVMNEKKIMDPENGTEYVPTYEDRDGDWMLVGDVPWNMFVESCKRLRLMKSSEAIGLAAPKTSSSNGLSMS